MGILDKVKQAVNISKNQAVKAGVRRPVENALPQVSDNAYNLVHGLAPAGTVTGQSEDAAAWYGPTPSDTQQYGYIPKEKTGSPSGGIENPLAILNGITGIVNNTMQLSDIADTDYQQSQINQMGNIGRFNVNSYDQLNNQYGLIDSYQPDLSYDTIRGGSQQERFGNLLTSVGQGAAAGAQVGGIWGGIAGGAIGLGAGVAGWLTGDRKAEDEQKRLRLESYIASDNALQNLQARAENLADYNFRNQVPRVQAEGGRIERKQTSLKEFADSVTNRSKTNPAHTAGIVREYCNGGVKIRIKR